MDKEKEVKPAVEETTESATVEAYNDEPLKEEIKAMSAELEKMKSIKINPIATVATKAFTAAQESDADFAKFARDGGNGRHEIKAVNITTPTEGQETVPIGHYNQIIARMEELGPLYSRLGVRSIPGRGTTVNVPIDNAAGGVMTATTESAAAPEDDPTFAQVAMTLDTYRTQVRVTYETLEDEDSSLLSFLSNRAARIATNTHNSLLLAEVAANGTAFHTFAAATGIAAGEMEAIAGNDALAPYIDDMNPAWVMRNATYMDTLSITGDRFYTDYTGSQVPNPQNRQLIGYGVNRSNYADAYAVDAKPVYFGNWDYVGFRQAPTFTVLRDPYSRAANGEVVFHYFMRTCYAVLQADAIGYGLMPAA